MADDLVARKVKYRLYPSKAQKDQLEHMLVLHQQLYNAALEHRIVAYRKAGDSIRFKEQCKELTILRRECPEYSELNAQSLQVTLKRLEPIRVSFPG